VRGKPGPLIRGHAAPNAPHLGRLREDALVGRLLRVVAVRGGTLAAGGAGGLQRATARAAPRDRRAGGGRLLQGPPRDAAAQDDRFRRARARLQLRRARWWACATHGLGAVTAAGPVLRVELDDLDHVTERRAAAARHMRPQTLENARPGAGSRTPLGRELGQPEPKRASSQIPLGRKKT